MNFFILLGIGFLALAGCAPTHPDLVVRGHSYPLAAQDIIIIEHFENHPELSTGVNKSWSQDLGARLALDLQKKLKAAGSQRPLVISRGEQVSGDLLIRGSILRVSGGERFHRLTFELFGFGASEVQTRGEVFDPKTSTALIAFSLTRRSSWSFAGNEGAVRENIEEIAEAIVKILLQAQE